MATMIERQAASVQKELEKLNVRKAREVARLEKKTAAAEKIGANCTREEWFSGKREQFTDAQRWAFTEVWSAQDDVADTERQISNAEKRLAKLTWKVEAAQETAKADAQETERIGRIEKRFLSAEERKARYEAWLKQFKAECAKDGIKIDEASANWFSGYTKGGKHFTLFINNGWTKRSLKCYTLDIAGNTVFTSGEFITAYRYLMNR